MGNLDAWIKLSLIPNIGKARLTQLVESLGSPEAVLCASTEEIMSVDGFGRELAISILEHRDKIDISDELRLIDKHNINVFTYKDEAYPENLKNITFPPAFIYVKGKIEPEDKFAVSIVGSRRFSQYGKMVCGEIAGQLADYGITIVSGMAQGIDSVAHQAALKKGCRTIAVLGNGLSTVYPSEHKGLMERIAQDGAVLSEFPMSAKPAAGHFPVRNRTIAGLGLGTLVIEAAPKSGSLITAVHAVEIGRSVYAVPGDINRENSRGVNDLIQKGAKLVQNADDIVSDMHMLLKGLIIEEKQYDYERVYENLSDAEKRILAMLKNETLYFDQILDKSELDMGMLSNALLNLEMKGLIRQYPGKMFGKNME